MDSKRRIKRALDQGQRDILKMGHRLKRCQKVQGPPSMRFVYVQQNASYKRSQSSVQLSK